MAGQDLGQLDLSAASGPLARYSVPAAGTLHWRRWDDDEMVVFDNASGSTHLLSAAAAEVLLALLNSSRRGQDALELAQRLLPADDGSAPAQADVQALRSVLDELARLGLVRCGATGP